VSELDRRHRQSAPTVRKPRKSVKTRSRATCLQHGEHRSAESEGNRRVTEFSSVWKGWREIPLCHWMRVSRIRSDEISNITQPVGFVLLRIRGSITRPPDRRLSHTQLDIAKQNRFPDVASRCALTYTERSQWRRGLPFGSTKRPLSKGPAGDLPHRVARQMFDCVATSTSVFPRVVRSAGIGVVDCRAPRTPVWKTPCGLLRRLRRSLFPVRTHRSSTSPSRCRLCEAS